ncbi:U5 small nuclear ribonucleoprotein 200 kDa helicase-like, partial [Trifolium medium]|nr:U5 small nuclear ribonucleoprotein 200 kDa helicase-like [Trifolium medium]
GKLDIAVLSIIHMIHHHGDSSKCVYLAPSHARVDEIIKNLSDRLTAYHVEVKPQSEDHTINGQIVVTTAEDWNVLTLHSGFRSCARSLKLFIIDELDFNNQRFGPIIESILARTVRENVTTKECNIRLVGLSATLPIDYNDIAAFLRVNPDEGLFYYDRSCTYIPLSQECNEVSEVKTYETANSVCNEN